MDNSTKNNFVEITPNITIIVISVFILTIAIICYLKWRIVIFFVFVALYIDGFIRRNIFDSVLIYFIKDIWLMFVYLGFLREMIRQKQQIIFKSPLNILFILWLGLVTVFSFSPALLSLKTGIIGWKLYLMYLPLFYVGYHVFSSKKQLVNFIAIFLLLSIPIYAAGFIQKLLAESILSKAKDIALITVTSTAMNVPLYKPEATFMFAGLFSWYLSLTVPIVMGNLLSVSKNFKLVNIALFLLTVITVMLSGARTPFAILLLSVVVIGLVFKKIAELTKLAVILLFLSLLVVFFYPNFISISLDRITTLFFPQTNIDLPAMSTFWARPFLFFHADEVNLLGIGAGAGSTATRYLAEGRQVYTEHMYLTLLIELGVIGFLLFITICIFICYSSYKNAIALHDADLKAIGIGIVLMQFAILAIGFVSNTFHQPLISIYWYFFSGIALSLHNRDVSN